MLGFRRRRKSTFFRRWLLSKREAQRFPAEPSFPANRRDIAPAAIGFLPVGAKGRSFILSLALCSQSCNSVQVVPISISLEGLAPVLERKWKARPPLASVCGKVFATPCGSSFSAPVPPALS